MNQVDQTSSLYIFTDAATSPQYSMAVGAFLCLSDHEISQYLECCSKDLHDKIAGKTIYKEYESKKSTWSEIKTVIEALSLFCEDLQQGHKIIIYTDCQSICDLLSKRKEKLVKNDFITRTGKILNNAMLYKELFAITNKFNIQIIKIKGHSSSINRSTIQEKIFAILDKLSRKRLRSLIFKKIL